MKNYGKELIMDLHDCDVSKFNRVDIEDYIMQLCGLINMERGDLYWWDYEDDSEGYRNAPPHLKGMSVVQFIMTSTIVIHTLDDLKKVYINIFSCKDFNENDVEHFTGIFFQGKVVTSKVVDRL